MKRKFLMILMSCVLSFSMLAGCGKAEEPAASVEDEDDDDDDRHSDDDDDEDEVKPEAEESGEENAPAPEEEDEGLDMPRSDAYEMFLAGEMDVNVIADPNDEYSEYMVPAAGTYSYDELINAVAEASPGTYDVKYTMFTPGTGKEGDDILVLYMENHDPSFYSWIGLASYGSDGLNMRYCLQFGYRSFFDLYNDGYVLYGGSSGAGSQMMDCYTVLPDSSLESVYRSSHLYSTWCGDITWTLDPDMDYELRPTLPYESGLEMRVVYLNDGDVRFSATGFSDNKSVKAEEERFIKQITEMGAVQVAPEDIDSLIGVEIDEGKLIDLSDLKTFDTIEKEWETD